VTALRTGGRGQASSRLVTSGVGAGWSCIRKKKKIKKTKHTQQKKTKNKKRRKHTKKKTRFIQEVARWGYLEAAKRKKRKGGLGESASTISLNRGERGSGGLYEKKKPEAGFRDRQGNWR